MNELGLIFMCATVAVGLYAIIGGLMRPQSQVQEFFVNSAILFLIAAGLYQIGQLILLSIRWAGWL